MRLAEPDLERHQVVQFVPLLGHAGGARQQHDTLHQMPGARALQPKQADEHALRVANFRRVTYFDSSRERGERLRRISSAEVNVSDRSVGDRATRHVVRRQIDVETLPGHRQPFGERSQFGERPGKPDAREHRREPRHAEPLSQPLAPGQLHALPEVDDRLVVLARRVMNRAEAQDGGGASGDIAEPNTDVQGTPGCRERGGVVAYDQEGVGQSGRDAAQPFLVSEIPGTDLGGPVMLENAVDACERLQGRAQVEPQVERLLLPLASLGKMLDGHQRILVRRHGLLERRARDGLVSSLPEVRGSRLPPLRPEGMMPQTLGVLPEPVGIEALDRRHDLAVQAAAPVLEETPVGYLVGKGVLERVLEIREEARLVQELRGLEAADRGAQLVLVQRSCRPEQRERHVLPNHRCRLQERLVAGGQPVDTGGQHGLHRGGDLDGRKGPRQPIRPALARQRLGLDKSSHALLQEKRIALRPRDQDPLQRIEAGVRPEQRAEERLGGLRWEGVQPELHVVGPAAPRVLILRPVVHEEQEPRRRQALGERVEQRLGLGVDPVEVLEDHQQRLDLTLAYQQLLQRLERSLATLSGIQPVPGGVSGRDIEERQERRQAGFLGTVQRQELPRHLLAHRPGTVPILDREVTLEEVDHRQIGRRLAVRDRAGLEHEPSVDAMRVRHLPHQPRFPDARLADNRRHLAVSGGGAPERLAQLVQLGVPPNEAGQAARGGRGQPGAAGSGPHQFVDFDRRVQALHGHRPQRRDLDIPLREPQRVGGEEASAARRELLHPGRQVRGLAHGGVVHPEIAPDGPDHDRARVQPDANLKRNAVGATHLLRVPPHGGLHVERGVARPHGVVLVRERGAEQRHDPVAHDLVDGALVAVDGLHHPLEDGIEQLPGFLGVAVGQELHRALEVGEQHGDLLALAFEGGLRGQDLLGEVLRGVALRCAESRARRRLRGLAASR